MIGIHQQLGSHALAGFERDFETRHNVRIGIQHRGDEHRRCTIVNHTRQPLGERCGGQGRDLDHIDTFLGQSIELATNGVKLAVCRDQLRTLAKVQSR